MLPTNISYLIKNESQKQFNQRPGESRLTFATRVYNTLEVWYKIGDASNLAEVEDFNMNHPNPANADNVQQMAKYRLALPRVDENEMVQKVIEGLTDGALKAHIVTQEISQIHGANSLFQCINDYNARIPEVRTRRFGKGKGRGRGSYYGRGRGGRGHGDHRMLTIPGKDHFKRKRDHSDDKRAKNYRTGGRETHRDDRLKDAPPGICYNHYLIKHSPFINT